MAEPIRFVHFSDLHIGIENYGRLDPATGLNRRVMDFLGRLDDVVAYAIDHDADLVLFAGDAFRSRRPSPTHQREFAQRIRALSVAGISVVLLVGNHDVPVMSQRASSIEIFSTLEVPGVIVADRPAVHRIITRRGPVQVVTIPYPVRQRLLSREQFRRMSQEELDGAVSEVVIGMLEALKGQLSEDEPAVLMGHFSVAGANWGSERSIMVGRDVTLPISALVDARWAYVALGHIHRHQSLNADDLPPVVYAGSLARVDFGEEHHPKGFCWVELEDGHASWHYVELPARRFVTLRIDVRGESAPLSAIRTVVGAHDLSGVVVRLIVEMSPEQEPLLRDVDLVPLLADAFHTQINREVDRAVRDRLDGMEPATMTPMHLLERYLGAIGKDESEFAPYLTAAQSIFASNVVDEG
ncbi:MAG: exonuclease SbcCD subunit D [Anaerolineae bacterium]|nr:exonuclease SbcCD subunit D [Anaerolineae bacterium]